MMTKTAAAYRPARTPGAFTPWGQSDHTKEIAPGIIFYSTPSHGGAFVPAEIRAEWPQALRDFKTFAGGDWYEEDCDVQLVILAHPESFKAATVADAVRFARAYCQDYAPAIYEWIDSDDEHATKARDIADLYNALKSELDDATKPQQ